MQSVSRFSAKQMADKLFLAGDIFIESHIRNKTFLKNNNKSNKKKNLFNLRMKKNTHLKKIIWKKLSWIHMYFILQCY